MGGALAACLFGGITLTDERRNDILRVMTESNRPVTGTELSTLFSVSRQVIVQDIALLRARGFPVIATPRGYMILVKRKAMCTRVFYCLHDPEELERELKTIIKLGGRVLDVVVEHPVYGEFRAELMLDALYQVDVFVARLNAASAMPLSSLTSGAHFHTVETDDEQTLFNIERALDEAGFLQEQ